MEMYNSCVYKTIFLYFPYIEVLPVEELEHSKSSKTYFNANTLSSGNLSCVTKELYGNDTSADQLQRIPSEMYPVEDSGTLNKLFNSNNQVNFETEVKNSGYNMSIVVR